MEAEFWRIVEEGEEAVEVLLGADLDTSQYGSGFPRKDTHPNDPYAGDKWNINNIPRLAGAHASLLRHMKVRCCSTQLHPGNQQLVGAACCRTPGLTCGWFDRLSERIAQPLGVFVILVCCLCVVGIARSLQAFVPFLMQK